MRIASPITFGFFGLLALSAGAAWLFVRPSAPAVAPPSVPEIAADAPVEKDGVRIQFELRDARTLGPARPYSTATATFTLTDATSGQPIRRAHPRAWMARREGAPPDEAACNGQIKSYLGGLLSVQPDVDLNAAWLLVMNDDNSLSVLNPHLAFSRTKLRSVISLPGKPADWALHPDGTSVYVSIPGTGQLSVVDTRELSARGLVDVGEGARDVVLSPDARRLFVSRDDAGRVAVVELDTFKVAGELELPPGRISLAFARDGREVYVASDASDAVRIFDALTLESLGEVSTGKGVDALAHHDAAQTVGAHSARTGELLLIDTARRNVAARIPGAPGRGELAFDPNGRWLFSLDEEHGVLTAVDPSTRSVRGRWEELGRPDALSFTPGYAYVRDTEKARVLLLSLPALSAGGDPGMAEVQIGQQALGAPEDRVLASPVAPTADGSGAIIASARDRALFFYTEGMMAPLGSIRNNGKQPQAVMLLDRGLREVQPGVYRTDVELGASGDYDVALLLDSPRVGTCLDHRVAPSDEEKKLHARHKVEVAPLFDVREGITAGVEQRLSFRVSDGKEQVPASEVEVLAFRPPGTWQWRGSAQQKDDAIVEVVLPGAPEGEVTVLLGVPGRGAPLGSLRPIRVGARLASASNSQETVQ